MRCLAWLNWMMLNLQCSVGALEMREGKWSEDVRKRMESGWAEKACVWVCDWGGCALFSHFLLCRSTGECGHGYRSGQHWSHLWGQHGKLQNIFHLSTPAFQIATKTGCFFGLLLLDQRFSSHSQIFPLLNQLCLLSVSLCGIALEEFVCTSVHWLKSIKLHLNFSWFTLKSLSVDWLTNFAIPVN